VTLSVQHFQGSPAEWDAFVRAQHGWTHFHLSGWSRAFHRVFGHECPALAVHTPDGALAGVLPLTRVKSLVFGHFLVSQPFVNYGGPLGSVPAVRSLVAEAVRMAAADGVKLLELRSRVELPVDLPVSHRKVTVVLDLERDAERTFKRFDSKLRSQIRRPTKEGVTVRFGHDQIGPFFRVFARHMRDLGTPVQPQSLFRALAQEFPEEMWVGCAYLGEEPVAGGVGFRWGSEFEMTWASSLHAHSRIAPNMLVYWSFMERCIQQGVTLFNFGRTTPGSGTHRFKLQWGSREEPLWWYQRSVGLAKTPSPDDARYAWGPRIWQRLPVPVATALGPWVVRGIP
jgi:FemAB-related protein (PEP-CTERM system-associated)